MLCPSCKKEVPDAPDCAACGIVIAKFLARKQASPSHAIPPTKAPAVPKTPAPPGKPAGTGPGPEMGLSGTLESEAPAWLRPVSLARMASVYYQLGRMLSAGMPVIQALALLEQQSKEPLRSGLQSARSALQAGASLTDALKSAPAIFTGQVRELTRIGEESGSLPQVFERLGDALQARLELRRRIVRACLYPGFLILFFFFSMPLSTLITEGLAGYLKASLFPLLILILIAGALFWGVPALLRLLLGRTRARALARALPWLGSSIKDAACLRFADHLALAQDAGLEVVRSVQLAARASGDAHLHDRIQTLCLPAIQQGATLADALQKTQLFDADFVLATTSGELSGKLVESLQHEVKRIEDRLIHRTHLQVWALGMLVLVGAAIFIVLGVVNQYEAIFGKTEDLIRDLTGGKPGAGIEDLLKELPDGAFGKMPPELDKLLK